MAQPDPYRELANASRAERARVFAAGTAPDIAALEGWEFRGWNTAWITGVLGFRKFVKGFFAREGGAYGCNSPAEQNGLEGDWRTKPSEDEPGWYAFYAVDPAATTRPRDAVLLDYGRGHNGFPAKLLRDHLVRVSPGSDDLLLGKAFCAIGPLRVPVSYFILERRRRAPTTPEFPGPS